MAIKWPLANGVWSNAANWNDGILPDVGDDVYADGKTITIDQNVNVLSIRTTQRSGGTNGGSFVHSGNFTVTANMFLAVNNSINNFFGGGVIIGNIYISNVFNASVINSNGNGTIIGNLEFVNLTTCIGIIKSSGKLTVIGNLAFSGNTAQGIRVNADLDFIGNVTEVSGVAASYAIQLSATASPSVIYLEGTFVGSNIHSVANAVFHSSNFAQLTINGTAIGGTQSSAVNNSGNGTLHIKKCVGSGNINSSQPGLSNGNRNAVCTVEEIEFGPDGQVPVSGYVKFLNTNTNKATIRKVNNTNITLLDSNNLTSYPSQNNVRSGLNYGSSQVGTLIVPSPSNVRKGVPTDNTVGTAELTAEDILNAIQTSNNPVAERLKNVATVQTTGDQIASL